MTVDRSLFAGCWSLRKASAPGLTERVEALMGVSDPTARAALAFILQVAMSEECDAFELRPDGTWVRRSRSVDTLPLAPQEELLRRAQTQTG